MSPSRILLRAENRARARKLIQSNPELALSVFPKDLWTRDREPWLVGYMAIVGDLSTEVSDYYASGNFQSYRRFNFKCGKEAALKNVRRVAKSGPECAS